jgi:hypothetical protein
MLLGFIVRWTLSGADTSLILPSDYPTNQNPSTRLLVEVMKDSRRDVKIYSSE